MTNALTRRAALLAGVALVRLNAAPAKRNLKVAIFSKHLQFLKGTELARVAAEIGFDGLDLTVRTGGHVDPARVAETLPPLVSVIRQHGLDVPMVTTDIVDSTSPHTRTVLKTLNNLGIRYYRWGGFKYTGHQSLAREFEDFHGRAAQLAALNAEYQVCAIYHTHSGVDLVGAPVWDIFEILKDLDPRAVAINYDVGHATVEGGLGGWIDSFRVAEPYIRGVAAKDFVWQKGTSENWDPQWVPLGQGMVRFPTFFSMLAKTAFNGPVQLHFEYPLGGADYGRRQLTIDRQQVFSAMRRDLHQVRTYLNNAGLSHARRGFCHATAALLTMPAVVRSPSRTAIRVEEITHSYQDFRYRAPYKFGGFAVDRVTLLNVRSVVRLPNGRSAKGFGSMTMGNIWSFPSRVMTYDQTLTAMKALAEKINVLTGSYREYGHPIDLNFALEPSYLNAAAEVTRDLHLAEPIPKLCTLVTASPFDAALHDAFGKIHGCNVYETYGPDLLPNDLSRYLGKAYAGRWLHQFLLKRPRPALPLYHSVGALDPLTGSEVTEPIHDGLPETLGEWIGYSGVDRIKIKLNGDDLDWDVNRVLHVDAVAVEVQARRRVTTWFYSLDFNERCRNVEYLLRFIRNLKERNPGAFNRIQYIEQPTRRDLAADRHNVMHEASRLIPVVIDESLTGLDTLLLAREMGYTGAALKACKGQSQAVLMAGAGQIQKMFLCVQDLTCPGASLIQSAGLAAHVPGVVGIEANARQYVPAANEPWRKRFPGIFDITNGRMATETLTGVGLGAV